MIFTSNACKNDLIDKLKSKEGKPIDQTGPKCVGEQATYP